MATIGRFNSRKKAPLQRGSVPTKRVNVNRKNRISPSPVRRIRVNLEGDKRGREGRENNRRLVVKLSSDRVQSGARLKSNRSF